MSAQHWLARAGRTLRTASLVLEHGDPDGACSSAYYAMFYATRAALYHVGQPERAMGKTHAGMIAAFHQFLVQPGLIPVRFGRSLQHEFSRRLIADYEQGGLTDDVAAEAVAAASGFVAAMRALVTGLADDQAM